MFFQDTSIKAKYQKCLDILLPPSYVNQRELEILIYELLSKVDNLGKSPTSYAFKYWHKDTIYRVLDIGPDMSQQDMEYLSPKVLEEYFDDRCISRAYNDNLTFQFDYSFLQEKIRWESRNNFTGLKPNLMHLTDKRNKAIKFEENVNFLNHMSNSSKHRHLVAHPVIVTFLWIKWRFMHFPLRRYRRFYFLFVASLMWFVFDMFGGINWNNLKSDNTTRISYCVSKNESLISHLLNHSFLLTTDNIDYPGDGLDLKQCIAKYGIWYLFFIIVGPWIIVSGLIDIYKQLKKKRLSNEANGKDGRDAKWKILFTRFNHYGDILFSEFLCICLVVFTLHSVMWWSPSKVLSIVITIQIFILSFIELKSLIFSPIPFIISFQNWLDVMLLSCVFIILFETNSWMEYMSSYSTGLHNDGSVNNNCKVKRVLSAAAIVISVFRYNMLRNDFVKNPMNYVRPSKIYQIMFLKVLKSFSNVLFAYSSQIISFGLGFYIMLHMDIALLSKDSGELNVSENKTKSEEYKYFDTPYYSLLKTLTMFTGEIEFSDIPMKGSNVSYVLGWSYYLLFLLTVVLVLMNLLNALAISDISKIIEDSKIEYMLSNIRDVEYGMDKFSLNPLSIIAQGLLCLLIVCFLPCIWGFMYWCEEDDLERFWRTRTSFDAINADTGAFTLDMDYDKRYNFKRNYNSIHQ